MMNVLLLMTVSGVISPTSAPSSTRQYLGSPSHPASVLPSKIGLKPGSSPVGGSGRSDCFGTYCAASRAAASAPRKTRRLLFDIVSYVISQKNRPCIICGYPYYYPSVSSRAATIFMRPPRTVAQPLRLPRPDSSGRSARFAACRYVGRVGGGPLWVGPIGNPPSERTSALFPSSSSASPRARHARRGGRVASSDPPP